jgi:hypothetical protein
MKFAEIAEKVSEIADKAENILKILTWVISSLKNFPKM